MKPSSRRTTRYYTFYRTNYGLGAIVFTDKGIAGLILPTVNRERVLSQVSDRFPQAAFRQDNCSELKDALGGYFRGEKVEFNFPLDLTGNSLFKKKVFSVTREVPYGKRRSYSWLASRLQKPKGYRAVGNALAKNPIPVVVPCHRVVRDDGSLGGFSAGARWKRRLLRLESKS